MTKSSKASTIAISILSGAAALFLFNFQCSAQSLLQRRVMDSRIATKLLSRRDQCLYLIKLVSANYHRAHSRSPFRSIYISILREGDFSTRMKFTCKYSKASPTTVSPTVQALLYVIRNPMFDLSAVKFNTFINIELLVK